MSDDLVKRLREGVWGRARRADAVIQTAMQDAADRLEKQAAEIARLNTRVAELEAMIDPVVLQAAKPFPVEEAIRKAVEGSLLTDQQKIEVYLAYKYRWIEAFFTGGRQRGLEEAAKQLEELHKNHKYNPKTGEGREHDAGYYRAISEGVAHILYAAVKEGEP